MTRRRVQIVTAVTLVVAVLGALASVVVTERRPGHADTHAWPDRAVAPAETFVDSIGVGVHLQYRDTAYARFDEVIEPRLRELGVRYVRDRAYTAQPFHAEHPYYRRLRRLVANGIRLNLVTDIQTPRRDETAWHRLGDVQDWTGGGVWAFEGVNEPDGFSQLPEQEWVGRTRAAQRQLWRAVSQDHRLLHTEVLTPALVSWRDRWSVLGDLSAWSSLGNWHPYPGAAKPTLQAGVFPIEQREDGPLAVSGGAPLVASETGYHNALESPSNGHQPISERGAAAYLPRMLLDYFRRGYARTFIYELIDERRDPTNDDPEQHFGLLRHDGNAKPAFIALRNLIDLLEDPGAPFALTGLAYRVVTSADDVRHLLLQKRDGTCWVALWRDVSVWDRDDRRDLTPAPVRAELVLADEMRSARVYRPNLGVAPIDEHPASSRIRVELQGDIVLIEVTR